MTINQIVDLFAKSNLPPEKQREANKRHSFNEVMQNFCTHLNIRSWEHFKKSNRIKTFKSPKLNRNITISGDGRTNKPEGCWMASEIEIMFEMELSTEDLDKVDKVKNIFDGTLVKVSRQDKLKLMQARKSYKSKC